MLQWNNSLSVADASIDEQHQMFIDKINEFDKTVADGKSAEEITTVFNFLRDYAKYHFIEEEKVMAEANYPDLQAHVNLHDGFVTRIIEMKTKLDTNGYNPGISAEMSQFMSTWLENHIRGADYVFMVFLKTGKRRPVVA